MNILKQLQKSFTLYERKKTLKILTKTEPEKIVQYGEEQLLKSFQRAARRVPAYRQILKKTGCDPGQIDSVSAFSEKVPLITKEDIFPVNSITDLCVDGEVGKICNAMSSSGFSGIFSFGVSSKKNQRNAQKAIDSTLDYIFDISHKKTLFINSLPMGVRVPTSLPVADTSVRWDMALAIYQKFASCFEQVLILSDPHFLKILLEEGQALGIDWQKENVNLITGGDWISESFRSYFGDILGTDWERMDRGLLGLTMGVAELDLSLFHESKDTIRIQRAALADKKLRYALYGNGCEVQPTLFHYYPHRTYLEIVDDGEGSPELVVSMLSDALLVPLIRYNVKDVARIYSYKELKGILHDCGYGNLCPKLKLPFVSVGGRKNRALRDGAHVLSPEIVKQALYSVKELAEKTTGYFRLSSNDAGLMIEIQLRKGFEQQENFEQKLKDAIAEYTAAKFQLVVYLYQEFPYSMELDYERKFKNI